MSAQGFPLRQTKPLASVTTMANREETSLGTQVVLAIVILFIAWVVLRWVIRVVVGVATTLVVIGGVVALLWFFLRSQQDSA